MFSYWRGPCLPFLFHSIYNMWVLYQSKGSHEILLSIIQMRFPINRLCSLERNLNEWWLYVQMPGFGFSHWFRQHSPCRINRISPPWRACWHSRPLRLFEVKGPQVPREKLGIWSLDSCIWLPIQKCAHIHNYAFTICSCSIIHNHKKRSSIILDKMHTLTILTSL